MTNRARRRTHANFLLNRRAARRDSYRARAIAERLAAERESRRRRKSGAQTGFTLRGGSSTRRGDKSAADEKITGFFQKCARAVGKVRADVC